MHETPLERGRVELAAARPDDSDLRPGTLVDYFLVRRLLGEGGMGKVYAARDTRLGRRVALKVIRSDRLGAWAKERFLEEARLTARFGHPHIITVYAVGEHNGAPYLALEYLEGETLRQRQLGGPLPPKEAMRVALAIAEALEEAHRHQVVHADLKPDNVFLPVDGRLRVVDFGLARTMESDQAVSRGGTPGYMAPERLSGMPFSTAADIWSLGVVLFELLEGRRPIEVPTLLELASEKGTLSLPDHLAAMPLGKLLARCLEIVPERRPTAAELATDLSAWLSEGWGRAFEPEGAPYRGLAAYTEEDAANFFGRRPEIDAFLERMRRQPVLPVVGPSGVGKSSFVQAGLMPRIREQGCWKILMLRPGTEPFRALADCLTSKESDPGTPEILQPATLRDVPGRLGLTLRAFAERTGCRVLLFVDQLEEVFSLGAPGAEADAFLEALGLAADDPGEGVRVIFTLREDYLARCARSGVMRRALGGTTVIAPLSAPELEEIVRAPLARAGYGIDDPLLPGRMAQEVAGLPAGLPLLQFACQTLWEQRDRERRQLLSGVYSTMGGVAGALARHGEEMLAELDPAQETLARALLLSLVNPDGTRRPRPRARLLAQHPSSAGPILDRFIDGRLVVSHRDRGTGTVVVELAHESLVESWPDLRRWMEETREERALLAELEQAAQLWEGRGQRIEETWTKEALADALRRVERFHAQLPTNVRNFLDAGQRREQSARARRRWLLSAVILALTFVAVGATVAALAFRAQQQETLRQRRQIDLAAGDIGRFHLVLAPFDLSSQGPRPVRSDRLALRFRFHAPDGEDPSRPGRAYQPDEARTEHLALGAAEEHIEQVETRSGPVFLEITGRGEGGVECGPSWVRIQQLPGFAEREQAPPREIRVLVPTCQATFAGTVEVPEGPYLRGGPGEPALSGGDLDHEPETQISVPAFSIDRTEVIHAAYGHYLSMARVTGAERPSYPDGEYFREASGPNAPVTAVNAYEAEAYCAFLGKRLPTEDEWLKAARGGLMLGGGANPSPRRSFPWGIQDEPERANLGSEADGALGIVPVGRFPLDVSPYGALDMAGNVSEWTGSQSRAPGLSGLRSVLGGNAGVPAASLAHALGSINARPARYTDFVLGFRCVVPGRRGSGS